jgi:DNA-binding transcriptional LysR family regulator
MAFLELEDLQTFVEIADAGGVSAAAKRLGVSKSIISRRLHRLEVEVGIQLIARTTRGASLTEAGAIFREHASRACGEMAVAMESLAVTGELRGRLRVAAPLSIGKTHLGPAFAEFARMHPRIDLHTSYSDQFVDVVSGGFDCAVRVGHLPDSTLVARRIAVIHTCLVASPDYVRTFGAPETPHDILSHEALIQGADPWRFLDGDKVVVVHPRGRFRADNGEALVEAAIAGLGIAKLCTGLFQQVPPGKLIQVMKRYPVAPTAAYMVRPGSPFAARKVHMLTDFLVDYFARPAAMDERIVA